MRFSQRLGLTPIKTELEKEGLSEELRNLLWSLVRDLIIDELRNEPTFNHRTGKENRYSPLVSFLRHIWLDFFKKPVDELLIRNGSLADTSPLDQIRNWFFKADWHLAFDFIEFCSRFDKRFQEICNNILKQEMSAYRFVDNQLVEISSKEEIIEIQDAIKNAGKYKSVKLHLKQAISLYSDRKKPDYRNSIKESISAVEAIAKIIVKNDKTTLGQALKVIEKTHKIPNALKSAFATLYGYTSDEGGIRHALLESSTVVNAEEARFMLIACSAFVNYLISKQ